jgi:glyoxylase-like metal-dependent hydrolase (beta-lactamase superfamily II)
MTRIERVLAPNPSVYTLEGTNTWIVGEAPSIVIDPGPADPGHLREIARSAGEVACILVTHDHEDHAEGAAALGTALAAPVHAVRVPGAEPLADGMTFPAGGVVVRAVATPGHSADHVTFHVAEARALFTGDAVLGRGTSFIDPPDGDLAAYLASLDRMEALEARTIHPGHGPVVLDAGAKIREYRAHRAVREQQVLDGLAAGERSVADLVATIYGGYPPESLPLAARSVTAHLLKLEAEARVQRRGHGAGQRWSVATPKVCARCGRAMTGPGTYCRRCLVTMLQGAGAPASAPDQP